MVLSPFGNGLGTCNGRIKMEAKHLLILLMYFLGTYARTVNIISLRNGKEGKKNDNLNETNNDNLQFEGININKGEMSHVINGSQNLSQKNITDVRKGNISGEVKGLLFFKNRSRDENGQNKIINVRKIVNKSKSANKRSEYNASKTTSMNGPCSLEVDPKTIEAFNDRVVSDGANVITLKLKFPKDIEVNVMPGVILPFQWRWLYRPSLSYLQMPYPATVWSLGLLYPHNGEPLDVKLQIPEFCPPFQPLTIGEEDTDIEIGGALGKMTLGVIHRDTRYTGNHWCYMRKIQCGCNELMSFFSDNFFNTRGLLEYVCCKFESDMYNSSVACDDIHRYDSMWWNVPIVIGTFMFFHFPLLFLKVTGMVHEAIKKSSKTVRNKSQPDTQMHDQLSESTKLIVGPRKKDIVYLDDNTPVTASSLIVPILLLLLPKKQSSKSRIAIVIWSLITLILPAIELILYKFYLFDYVSDLAKNDIAFGFSSMLIGWDAHRLQFTIFGGPYIAVGLYLILGWILMLSPKVMVDQLYYGIPDGDTGAKSILTINLKTKEFLGHSKILKHRNGYFRLLKVQISHLYMLVNQKFWLLEVQIVKERWRSFLSAMNKLVSVKIMSITIATVVFPVYVIISLLEIVLAIFYYACPMVSFIFCSHRGFIIGVNKYISDKCYARSSLVRLVLRVFVSVIVFLFLSYYFYIFVVLFFENFFFLSRILMYSYTAVVAYPRETYGFIMLITITIYFALKGFIHFGDIYRAMLKITVNLCKNEQTFHKQLHSYKEWDGVEICGIPRDLFEHLIENIFPRRIQALHTVIKLVSLVFMLSISIILLGRFKKYEDLSLLVHIFITVFICALPAIYNSLVSKERNKMKLKKKIYKQIQNWIIQTQNDL